MKQRPIIAAFLTIITLGLAACIARANPVALEWDPHPPVVTPGLTINYRIEMERGAPWGDAGVWKQVATGIVATTSTFDAGDAGPVKFRAFAYYKEKPEIQSYPSNVLTTEVELAPPANLRKVKVALQTSTDLKTWRDIAVVEKDLEEKEFFRTSAVISTPGK